MSATSSIEWTDRTWNPVRGCSVVSPGCVNCYAMKQAHRFSGKGKAYEGLTKLTSAGPQWTGKIRLVEEALAEPRRWRKPSRVFVNSMSDLFHESVPFEFVARVMDVIAATPHHTYQILTKRAERMLEFFGVVATAEGLAPPPNMWLGVSVENQATADERVPLLLHTPAAIRFASCEPLLGPLHLADACYAHMDYESRMTVCDRDLALDWVIVGGESGSGARRCDLRWVRDLVRDCRSASVPVFVKQLGARPDGWWTNELGPRMNRHGMRDRKGADPSEWPEDLRLREYPEMAGAIANDGEG